MRGHACLYTTHVITLMQGKVSDDELQTIKGILLRGFH